MGFGRGRGLDSSKTWLLGFSTLKINIQNFDFICLGIGWRRRGVVVVLQSVALQSVLTLQKGT